jgi:alanine racemase
VNPLQTDFAGSFVEIDEAAIIKNLNYLKKKSSRDKMMAVVKADAYGHGAVRISKLIENDVDQLAVATVDEGIQLRNAGIEIPILVFTVPTEGQGTAFREYSLAATISDFCHFGYLEMGTEYQLNFDTGMKRIGFYPNQVADVKEWMQKYDHLNFQGIYSHYATADDPGSEFVESQMNNFKKIRSCFPPDVPAHMSNTSAILHYKIDHFDMIRPGIGLFGYAPGKVQSDDLIPVMSWKTRVVLIREIKRGERVSYGGTWIAPDDGYLATLPVGYGDGIPRSLSNKLEVEIEGKLYPVAGAITMDHCMVYLGSHKVRKGAIAELLGDQSWLANTWAERAHTITHEILCRLTPRVRREYQ